MRPSSGRRPRHTGWMRPAADSRAPRTALGHRFSVRVRILASILLVAAIGLTAAGAITFLVQRDRILASVDDRLLSRVEAARVIVSGESAVDGADGPPAATVAPAFTSTSEALEGVLARLIPDQNESAVGLLDGRAAFVPGVQIDFHLERDAAFLTRVGREVSDGTVRLGTAVTPLGRLRYIAVPLTASGDDVTGIYVTAVDLDAELSELTDAFRTFAVVAVLALAAIGVVGWFVAGRLLRPIRRLRIAASRITASELQERIAVEGRDDFSELTETVNDMLDRLDSAMTGQRQLLDDVRHELKTPITIIRGHLELVDAANPGDVRATRDLAIDELDRMSHLVDDIESLAESQRFAPVARPVDLSVFTSDVFAKASVLASHEWALSGSAAGSVSLDPGRVTQAWLQLVDNAVKYSPAGSLISLGSTTLTDVELPAGRGDAVEFWVADAGGGIPEESQARIFERFGRVDTGRGIRGSGLGLPIVLAIARAHGGRVSLLSTPAGSRFGIVIPRADTALTDGAGTVTSGQDAVGATRETPQV